MDKNKSEVLKDYIIDGKIDPLLRELQDTLKNDSQKELTLINLRYNKNEKEHLQGLKSRDQYDVEFHKIILTILDILEKNKSRLDNIYQDNEFLPELTFDYDYNLYQDIPDLIQFLNEYEFNLKNGIKKTHKIIFKIEKVLKYELNNKLNRKNNAAIKNSLHRIKESKDIISSQIELLITDNIHYGLTNNKRNQAIVLRSLIYGLHQSGLFKNHYVIIHESGVNLSDLYLLNAIKSEKKSDVPAKNIFLNGLVPKGHQKVDIFNNKVSPRIVYSIWLSREEFKEFESNYENASPLGKSTKEKLFFLAGDPSFSATGIIPYDAIFEKLIPQAISNAYCKKKSGKVGEEWLKKALYIDDLSSGYG